LDKARHSGGELVNKSTIKTALHASDSTSKVDGENRVADGATCGLADWCCGWDRAVVRHVGHDFLPARCSDLGRGSSAYVNVRRSSRNIPRNSKSTMSGIMVILECPELLFGGVVHSMAGVCAVVTIHVSDLGVALMAVIAPNNRIVVTMSHRNRVVCHEGPFSHLEQGTAAGSDARVWKGL
jgi:hypothetical protein